MIERKLNDYEAFRVGMNLEKQGIEFYTKYAGIAKDPETKKIMLKMAGDEEEHLNLFKELSGEVGEEYANQPLINDELVGGYLNSLVSPGIFNTAPPDAEKMSEEDALKFALQAEKDSILFYSDAYNYSTNASGKEAFQRLIKEEQEHFIAISDLIGKVKK